jgi:hypothetical protein
MGACGLGRQARCWCGTRCDLTETPRPRNRDVRSRCPNDASRRCGFHRGLQGQQRQAVGKRWQEHKLVFASTVGTERNPNNVLRSFRAVLRKADLVPVRPALLAGAEAMNDVFPEADQNT